MHLQSPPCGNCPSRFWAGFIFIPTFNNNNNKMFIPDPGNLHMEERR